MDCCNHNCREGRDCKYRQKPQKQAADPLEWICEIPVVPYLACAVLIALSLASILFFSPIATP